MMESWRPKRGHLSGMNNERGLLSGFPGTEDEWGKAWQKKAKEGREADVW